MASLVSPSPTPSASPSFADSSGQLGDKRRLSLASSTRFDDAVPPMKRIKAKTSKDKVEERKQRNREAAQQSRDRKKAQQNVLEQRLLELEQRLAAARSTTSLNSLSPASQPQPNLPPSVPSPALSSTLSSLDPMTSTDLGHQALVAENQTLRAQLQLEKFESQSLKNRLNALEAKFARLESIISGEPLPAAPVVPPPLTYLEPYAATAAAVPATSSLAIGPELGATAELSEPIDSRIVARYASLPRESIRVRPTQLSHTMRHPQQARRPAQRPSFPQILASLSTNFQSNALGTNGRKLYRPQQQPQSIGLRYRVVRPTRQRLRTVSSMTSICSPGCKIKRFQLQIKN